MISEIGTPAFSPQAPTPPGGMLGKDEFLKMLVAQLRNQDPLNPMNGDDMAAQLAHFSSLEQLTNIHETLLAQSLQHDAVVGSVNDNIALSVLGKTVLAVGDQLLVGSEDGDRAYFEVDGQGGEATLLILDESGREVGSRPLGFVKGGRHDFELGSAADGLAAGRYRFDVRVVDAAGKSVATQTFIHARVDGVRYSTNGPILTSGPLRVPFGTILQVTTD